MHHLEEGGLLKRAGDGGRGETRWVWVEETGLDPGRPEGPWASEALGRYAEILDGVLAAYPQVLRGAMDPAALLFPQGSTELVRAVYAGNAVEDAYHRKVGDAVAAYVEGRLGVESGASVRILEVGAGTGSTTRFVLERIRGWAGRVTYYFTDVGAALLRQAEREWGREYPWVRFEALDVERGERPGWLEGGVDVVVAANVLHATRSVRGSLARIKGWVRAGGLLVVSEMTAHCELATMTFGLTGGWWRYEDVGRRLPFGPLLGREGWFRVLREVGWVRGLEVRLELGVEWDPMQHIVLLAESDGWTLETMGAGESGAGESGAGDGGGTGLERRGGEATVGLEGSKRSTVVEEGAGNAREVRARTVEHLRGVFSELLKLDPARIGEGTPFDQMGMDSLLAAEILAVLERDFGALPAILLMDRTTIGQVADYLVQERGEAVGRRMGLGGDGGGQEGEAGAREGEGRLAGGSGSVGAGQGDGGLGQAGCGEAVDGLSEAEVEARLKELLHG